MTLARNGCRSIFKCFILFKWFLYKVIIFSDQCLNLNVIFPATRVYESFGGKKKTFVENTPSQLDISEKFAFEYINRRKRETRRNMDLSPSKHNKLFIFDWLFAIFKLFNVNECKICFKIIV